MSVRLEVQQRRRVQASAKVLGLACAKPEFSILQSDAATLAQQLVVSKRWLHAIPALYRKSRVNQRGSVLIERGDGPLLDRQSFYRVATSEDPFGPSTFERMRLYGEKAGPLLISACHGALVESSVPASSITHIVTVSCTGFAAPGLDLQLMHQLNLTPDASRSHIGFMGCHGAINGLRVAQSIVEADPEAIVLLGAVELCSLHQQYSDDAQQLVANSLFADGAAAMVIGATTSESSLGARAFDMAPSNWTLAATMSQIVPGTSHMMSWMIGNFGFQMSLDPKVPETIQSHLRPTIQRWLDSFDLDLSDIDAWAIHPGGPRIVEAAGTALGLDDTQVEHSLSVLRDHGNMSSPTVLFILDRIVKTNPSASRIGLLAFGPGLCMEACLLVRVD